MKWTGSHSKGEAQNGKNATTWQRRLKSVAMLILSSLTPSFRSGGNELAKENKVAYLDGLRGVAAFVVYCTHYTAFSHEGDKRLHHSFGYRDEYYLACFPIIRLFFFGGPFAVAIFFAISGYVLSASPMKMLYKPREATAYHLVTQLGCSFPRRFVRLYLPVVFTTFVFMSSWHLFGIRSALPVAPGPGRTYFEDIFAWMADFLDGSCVFVTTAGFAQSPYNPHIWTIAEELRGSVIIYTTILVHFALGYGPRGRFWINLAVFSYLQFLVDGPNYALFVMGMLICDLDLALDMDFDEVPSIFKSRFFQKQKWFYYFVLLLGLYLGSTPGISDARNLSGEPGWATLRYLVPPSTSNAARYFCAFSGSLCILCIPHIPCIRRIFESSICQYLGKVSFGFYLVHGPVVWTVGDRLVAAFGRPRRTAKTRIPGWINLLPISHAGPLGLELSVVVPHLILLPLILWLAGIITKTVDGPSVTFSKWLFKTQTQRVEASNAAEESIGLLPRYEEHASM